jgi:hypothetical protein
MARDKDKDEKKQKTTTYDASGPLYIRVLKVGFERLASAGGKQLAGNSYVQNAVDYVKEQVDKVGGAGSADAFFDSEAFKILAAGGIQLPGTFLRPTLARLLRVDESLADEIVQEGVDKAILSFLDETGRAAKGKNPAEQKAIIESGATKLETTLRAGLMAANREGLRHVGFDPMTGLAHMPECKALKDRDGKSMDRVLRKDDAGNDFTLLAARKLGGRMTSECDCVGNFADPAGTLDEALMRLDGDQRRAFDALLVTHADVRGEILKKGSLAKDITATKIWLILKTDDAVMRKERLMLLVRAEGPKPKKSPVEKLTDYAERGIALLTDDEARKKFVRDSEVAADSHRNVNRILSRSLRRTILGDLWSWFRG